MIYQKKITEKMRKFYLKIINLIIFSLSKMSNFTNFNISL